MHQIERKTSLSPSHDSMVCRNFESARPFNPSNCPERVDHGAIRLIPTNDAKKDTASAVS
jgi:hypothetical protein